MYLDKIKNNKYYLIIFLGSFLSFLMMTNGHSWGDDFAGYIMQAKSIVNHSTEDFVAQNSFTINNSSFLLGPITYPWGLPLILAPLYAYFGLNLLVFKILNLFFYILFLMTLFLGFENRLNRKELLFFICIFAFNPYLLSYIDEISSDIIFLFFSTITFFLILKNHNNNFFLNPYADSLILGGLLAILFLLRINGLVLFLILAFSICLKYFNSIYKSFKEIIYRDIICFFLSSMLFLLIVSICIKFLPEIKSTHLENLHNVSFRSLHKNFMYYLFLLKDFYSRFFLNGTLEGSKIIGKIIYLLLLPFFIIGFKQYWKENKLIVLYVFFTFAIYIIWPFRQGLRFIFPIIPFYIWFLILGLRKNNFFQKKYLNYLRPLVCIALFFFATSLYCVFTNLKNNRNVSHNAFGSNSMELYSFIKNNLTDKDIVVFRKPRVMTLMTGRPSIAYDKTVDFVFFDYLIIDKFAKNSGQICIHEEFEFIRQHPVDLVYTNQAFDVYKFQKTDLY